MLLAVVTLIGAEKIVTFIVMLSILIVLHELGHFILARVNQVKVNEFALGFGPKLVGWTSPKSGTLYSIRAFFVGGFCAMEGEDNKKSEGEQQREFQSEAARAAEYVMSGPVRTAGNFQAISPWRRLAIIVAGPFANFVLCYIILLISALAFGVASDKVNQPVVGAVLTGTPAAAAGIRSGDRIVALNGLPILNGKTLVDTIHGSLGKRLNLVYERNGIRTEVHVVPRPCPVQTGRNLGCIGFAPVPAYERVGFREAVADSGIGFVTIAHQTVDNILLIVTQFTKYAPQVSGVIGIGQIAGTVEDWGWGPYLSLAATISFFLGLVNLVPFPALDGGRAAFIVAEIVRGRPVDPDKEAMVHFAGFAALMALVALVAFHDIARIIKGQGIL